LFDRFVSGSFSVAAARLMWLPGDVTRAMIVTTTVVAGPIVPREQEIGVTVVHEPAAVVVPTTVSPAGSVSISVVPVATPGPAFVTVILNVVLLPTETVEGATVFVTAMSTAEGGDGLVWVATVPAATAAGAVETVVAVLTLLVVVVLVLVVPVLVVPVVSMLVVLVVVDSVGGCSVHFAANELETEAELVCPPFDTVQTSGVLSDMPVTVNDWG
jgi:hypothetical protein